MSAPFLTSPDSPGVAPAVGALRWLAAPRWRLSLVREATEQYDSGAPLTDPGAAARFLWSAGLDSEPAETMGALYLDSRHRLLGVACNLYRGTLSRASVEPRAVLVTGLLANAGAFILYHNHPSGDPTPSAEDFAFTRRLAEAGEAVGVRLLDHLIIGSAQSYVSLRARGGW